MATDEQTMEERLQAWGDEVSEEFGEEALTAAQQVEALGGPGEEAALQALAWANEVDRETLLFTLAICVSEIVRRWGIEASHATLSALLEEPAIAAIGEIVHAGFEVDSGDTPERFRVEDIEAAMKAALEGDDDVVIVDMDTGEVIT